VCGEQAGDTFKLTGLNGSPPRVRGTESLLMPIIYLPGITPACAGNRANNTGGINGGTDHPRVCGEQGELSASGTVGSGSPPRVRGTDFTISADPGYPGITPACAGNSIRTQ